MGKSVMGKRFKEHPKYHVVSIRVSNEEKALLEALTRRDQTNITNVVREAITIYTSCLEQGANGG